MKRIVIGVVLIISVLGVLAVLISLRSSNSNLANIPTVKTSCLNYVILGSSPTTLLIQYQYPQNPGYDTGFEESLDGRFVGSIGVNPPPSRTPMNILFIAISASGSRSKPYIIDNTTWWNRVSYLPFGCAATHIFTYNGPKPDSESFSSFRFTQTPVFLVYYFDEDNEKELIAEKWKLISQRYPNIKKFVINPTSEQAAVDLITHYKESEIIFYYKKQDVKTELHFIGDDITLDRMLGDVYFIKEDGFKTFTDRIDNVLLQ